MPVPHDDQTAARAYPLPHPGNPQRADVQRLRTALENADADMQAAHDRASAAEDRLDEIEDALLLGLDIT